MMASAQIHNLDGNNQPAVTRASSTIVQNISSHIVTVGAVTLSLQLLLSCSNNEDNNRMVEIAISVAS